MSAAGMKSQWKNSRWRVDPLPSIGAHCESSTEGFYIDDRGNEISGGALCLRGPLNGIAAVAEVASVHIPLVSLLVISSPLLSLTLQIFLEPSRGP